MPIATKAKQFRAKLRDAKQINRVEAIINSMTPDERKAAMSHMDEPTVRAVLSSPHWLTGVLQSELPLIQAEYRKKFHASDWDRAKRLRKAM